MKIQKIINQHRRDFSAVYECEACGETLKGIGYDDTNFHQNVIPAMGCKACGKSSNDLGEQAARPLAPRHSDSEVM